MRYAHTESYMKLMIVDNDDTMREVIRGIVTRPGDEVVECTDGDQVVSAFSAFQADWVLMDIQMAHISGLQATRLLKDSFPNVHVAILTQYRGQEFRDEAKLAGAEQYLLKDDLSSVRQSLLSNAETAL